QLGLFLEDAADVLARLLVFGAHLGGGGSLQQSPEPSAGQSAGGLAFGLAALGPFVTQLELALVDRAHLRCGLAGGGPVPGAGFGHAERLPRGRRRVLALLAVFVVGLRTVVVGCGLLVAVGLGRTFGRLLLAAALGRAAARE